MKFSAMARSARPTINTVTRVLIHKWVALASKVAASAIFSVTFLAIFLVAAVVADVRGLSGAPICVTPLR